MPDDPPSLRLLKFPDPADKKAQAEASAYAVEAIAHVQREVNAGLIRHFIFLGAYETGGIARVYVIHDKAALFNLMGGCTLAQNFLAAEIEAQGTSAKLPPPAPPAPPRSFLDEDDDQPFD